MAPRAKQRFIKRERHASADAHRNRTVEAITIELVLPYMACTPSPLVASYCRVSPLLRIPSVSFLMPKQRC